MKLLQQVCSIQGRIQDFKLGGGALKKIVPSRGRRENCWGISCEKSRFYAKTSYFSNFRGGARNCWDISCEKSRFYAKKIIFLPILGGGGRAGCAPPPLNPPLQLYQNTHENWTNRSISMTFKLSRRNSHNAPFSTPKELCKAFLNYFLLNFV